MHDIYEFGEESRLSFFARMMYIHICLGHGSAYLIIKIMDSR